MTVSYLGGIAITTGINIIAVLGVTLLLGFTGLFTFGHAAYMAVGAYVSALASMRLGTPFPVSLLLGMVATAICTIPVGYPTLRLKGDYFVIGTLGVSEIIILLLENLDFITGGARGLPGIPIRTNLWNTAALVAVAIWLVRNFVTSRYGRDCVAVREDELAAGCIGINTFRTKMLVLMLSGALAGLAGGLMAHYVGLLHPRMFGIIRSTDLTIMVIFGGLGSITGSVVAAAVLSILPEVLRATAEWRFVAYGVAVVAVMVMRPSGLLGYRELTAEGLRRFLAGASLRRRVRQQEVP